MLLSFLCIENERKNSIFLSIWYSLLIIVIYCLILLLLIIRCPSFWFITDLSIHYFHSSSISVEAFNDIDSLYHLLLFGSEKKVMNTNILPPTVLCLGFVLWIFVSLCAPKFYTRRGLLSPRVYTCTWWNISYENFLQVFVMEYFS